jgi:hypothetical protein
MAPSENETSDNKSSEAEATRLVIVIPGVRQG